MRVAGLGSSWRVALLLYGGAVLIGINLVAVPASSVYLKELHGLTDQQYGSVFLPQLVAAIAGALIAGRAVLSMSLKSMFIASLLAFCLSLACLVWSSRVGADAAMTLIMLSTALFGFGFGFGGGPLNGLVCLQYPRNTSSAITALHMMAGVGLVAGPIYFSALESMGLWSAGPLLAALVALCMLAGVWRKLDDDEPQVSSEEGKRLPVREVYFWLMAGVALLYGFVEATFSNWAVIFVNQARGLPNATGATALSSFWAGLTVGRLIATLLVRSVDPFKLWITFPFAIALTLYAIPLAFEPWAIILAFACGGLACSAFFPLLITIASEPFPHAVSWIVSMLTAALMGGVGVVSYVVGSAIESVPIDDVYSYSVIYPALILGLILIARKISKRLGSSGSVSRRAESL